MIPEFDLFILELMKLMNDINNSGIDFDETIVNTRLHCAHGTCTSFVLPNGEYLLNWFPSETDYSNSTNFIFPNMNTVIINSKEEIKIMDQSTSISIEVNMDDITSLDEYKEKYFITNTIYDNKLSTLICLSNVARSFIKQKNRIGILYPKTNFDLKKELDGIHYVQKKLGFKSWVS